MTRLHLAGLSAGFRGRRVIADLDLGPLVSGEVTALVGPNAAGKSTLLKAIAGMCSATGSIRLDDTDLLSLRGPARAARVGYLPQTLGGDTGLTVLESVIAALLAPGFDRGRADPAPRRAMLALERLGIAHLASASLGRLSGGQRQLAGLAAALVHEPPLVLLDEPTSALDLSYQVQVMAEMRAAAARGCIVVAVLHDLALAARWADRIVVLDQGAIAGVGAPAAVVTPAMLARVYGVSARIEPCSRGLPQIIVDQRLPNDPRRSKAEP